MTSSIMLSSSRIFISSSWLCIGLIMMIQQQQGQVDAFGASLSFTNNRAATSSVFTSNTRLYNDLFDEDKKTDETPNTPPPPAKIEYSKAIPFVPRPKLLDGTLAADVGFDPFNFGGGDKASLMNMREAEIKHCRLAMLAVVGWPLAELFDTPIANTLNLPALLTNRGLNPSILNGGLDKVDILYWIAVIILAGIVEIESNKTKELRGKDYIPGDCNFDPLNLYPKRKEEQLIMQTKEIKHGRISMMALVGYITVELLYQKPIIGITPEFFTPMF